MLDFASASRCRGHGCRNQGKESANLTVIERALDEVADEAADDNSAEAMVVAQALSTDNDKTITVDLDVVDKALPAVPAGRLSDSISKAASVVQAIAGADTSWTPSMLNAALHGTNTLAVGVDDCLPFAKEYDKKQKAAKTDCTFSEWIKSSDCSQACGEGTYTEKRTLLTKAANGGKPCPPNAEVVRVQPCNNGLDCDYTIAEEGSIDCPPGTEHIHNDTACFAAAGDRKLGVKAWVGGSGTWPEHPSGCIYLAGEAQMRMNTAVNGGGSKEARAVCMSRRNQAAPAAPEENTRDRIS